MIKLTKHQIGKEEIVAVNKVLLGNQLTPGKTVKQFETNLIKYIGCNYAVAVQSATAGLHIALLAHGVKPGDEVIVPSVTFSATAIAVSLCGAKVVLADIDPFSLNIDVVDVENKITEKTKAILPVYYAGNPYDIKKLFKISNRYNIPIIEDAACAMGSSYHGQMVGSMGLTTVFSFHPTKNMTAAGGGAVTTNTKKIAEKIKQLRWYGLRRYDHFRLDKLHAISGNYVMNEIQAAIGIEQLKKLPTFNEKRRIIGKEYDHYFKNLINARPLTVMEGTNRYIYVLLIDKDRKEVRRKLKRKGIETQVHYTPLNKHPAYEFTSCLTNTNRLQSKYLSIPIHPQLSESDINKVVNAIHKIIG